MKFSNKRVLTIGSSGLILALGLTLISLLVFLPVKNSKAHDEVENLNVTEAPPQKTNTPEYIKPNLKIASVRKGLMGDLFTKIPSYFELAFSINIPSFSTFFWAHSLFNLTSQPDLRRKIDSLELSLNGIEGVAVGLLPRRRTVSWTTGGVTLTMPPLMFLFNGPRGRMEALRKYWEKTKGRGTLFQQGDFQLGFPMGDKPHFFVGSYRTSLTPIMKLAETPTASYDLCSTIQCKRRVAALGLIPDTIFIYHPKRPRHVKGSLYLHQIIAGIELNPDGVLFRADIATNLSCKKGTIILKKFIRQAFTSLKYQQSFLEQSLVQCPGGNRMLVTISMASSQVRHHMVQLGFLKK